MARKHEGAKARKEKPPSRIRPFVPSRFHPYITTFYHLHCSSMLLHDFFTIKDFSGNEPEWVYRIALNAEHPIYHAHFQNNPITPGACIVQMVKELAQAHHSASFFIRCVKNVKFLHVINPLVHPEIDVRMKFRADEDGIMAVTAVIEKDQTVFCKLNVEMVPCSFPHEGVGRFSKKSHSDDTLLTVGFNHRISDTTPSLKSRRDDTSPSSTLSEREGIVSSLRDLDGGDTVLIRRLKPAVNKGSSLRDLRSYPHVEKENDNKQDLNTFIPSENDNKRDLSTYPQSEKDTKPLIKHLQLCIIIPTYNNAKTLVQVLNDVLNITPSVIVVNDGSTDGSTEILKHHYADKVEIVSCKKNRGKGHALKCGFNRAEELGYRSAITLDSDGQHFAADIKKFVEYAATYPDEFLAGQRIVEGQMPAGNNFANKFSNFWFTLQTGRNLRDTQNGFRLYPLSAMKGMRPLTSRFEAELELLVRAAWKGIPIRPVPVNVFYPPKDERVSHFRPTKDFLRISLLNACLTILSILYGYPSIVCRKLFKST